ncbi:putative Ig domain-containing protein, partial [candidate division KSB1 bacterium]
GINDNELQTWHKGKVFYTGNDGQTWSEVNFGQSEDRFIWSIYVNPFNTEEVWISEGPLYNSSIDPPYVYKSLDGGTNWQPVYLQGEYDNTQVRIIGASEDGRVYISAGSKLLYTNDGGTSYVNIEPSLQEMASVDFTNISIHPDNHSKLFLPLRAGGIAYSENGGIGWEFRNDGIIGTNINLIDVNPSDPSVIYAASMAGEGTFRSDDYGESWTLLNPGGIVHPWGDELTVDPVVPDNVWFITDVPYIHKSSNRGTTWGLMNNPYQGGDFNFCSIYAMDVSSDGNTFYVLNNGFGIFKSIKEGQDIIDWTFLRASEVDYTYSIDVNPDDKNIVFSGYTRKPFQTSSKVQATYDGGETWEKVLEVEGTESFSTVVIDPLNTNNVIAVSTGDNGGTIWKSSNNGQNWQKTNDYFNFTTIHSFTTASGNSPVAYAGTWGGGIYKTADFGQAWNRIEAEEVFSAAAIAVDPVNPQIVYAADRSKPLLYKSSDGGETWSEYFDAGLDYRRLMCITIDPSNSSILYVGAMKMGGPGMLGGTFKIINGVSYDINGSLPKVPLAITVDPGTPDIAYTVLHESGVYRSTNGGTTWTNISGQSSGLPESGFNNLIIDPNDSNTLFLTGGCDVRFSTFESAGLDPDSVNSVYKSIDGGQTWTNIGGGMLGAQSGAVKSLNFYNGNSDQIYLGTENGVYFTTDGGENWQKSSGLPYNTLGGISISSNTIYAFTNGAGLFTGQINPDNSITWNSDQKLINRIFFAQLLFHPEDDMTIYASGYPGGVFKSEDGGVTWHEKNFGMVSFTVDDPLRQGYYALDISRSDPDIMFLGLYGKGIYRSFNSGDTWYQVNGLNREMAAKKITTIKIDPDNENIIYVGTEDGVFRSANSGSNWTDISSGLVSGDVKTMLFSPGGELFAGTRGYGLFSYDGIEWNPVSGFGNFGVIWPMWNDRPMYQYTSLLIHPVDNSKMLIGTFPQGIYKSTDGGNSWRESNIGWTMDGVFCLVTHPDNPEIVYSGTYNGINRSLDFGESWELWDNGWPDEQWVFSIDFDPVDPEIMYACSKNGENEGTGSEEFKGTVLKTLDGGANWFEITDGLDKDQEFYKIIVDKFDNNTVYLASQSDGMYISRDGGANWTLWNEGLTNQMPGTNGNNVTNMLSLSADHSILYFGSAGSGVFRRMITPILPANNLSADVQNHAVTLNWNFDDLNSNFSKYNVYRSAEYFENITGLSPYAAISGLNSRTYTDENIEKGIQYYYAVTTVDVNSYENPHFYVLGPVVDYGTSITSAFLDTAFVNISYVDTLQAQGGELPFTWEIIQGSLPAGLNLDTYSGIIAGIPTSSGTFTFTIQVTDSHSSPYTDTNEFTLMVAWPASVDDETDVPDKMVLHQNYPNPFNPETTIRYDLSKRSNVIIRIYDILGKEIKTLVSGRKPAGYYNAVWDGRNNNGEKVSSGLYIYQIIAGDFVQSKKMVLLR